MRIRGDFLKESAEERVERRLTQDIICGVYQVNHYLPPERQLSETLGVSRPVVHKALIRLEGRGLVSIVARQGVRVNDYKINGKLDLLESLLTMEKWKIDVQLHRSMMAFIKNHLIHILQATSRHKRKPYLEGQPFKAPEDLFTWMHQYALDTENFIDAMLFNEFKTGIINVGRFLVENDISGYQDMRYAIDQAVNNGSLEQITFSVEAFFAQVEFYWYRRCEDEAAIRT